MCTEEVAAESTTRRPKHRRQRLQSLVLLGHRGHAGVGALGRGRGGDGGVEASGVLPAGGHYVRARAAHLA